MELIQTGLSLDCLQELYIYIYIYIFIRTIRLLGRLCHSYPLYLGEGNYNIVVATSRSNNFHVKPEAKTNMLMVYVTSYSISLYVFENYTAILPMYIKSGCEGDYFLC